ncbi:MAG: ABC transporter substrate-binding protein, partial [Oscillospiraceae bacterium]|nr:ABC transporter substrate-binding protein [Oscillospiraceae bacterium]
MKKILALALALMMVMAMFAGCGKEKADPNVLKIGLSGPLTGGAAVYGAAVEAGMKIAVEEINAKGGLQIAFKSADDEHDGEKALNAYNNL